MSTFQQLQEQYVAASFKKAVLKHLVEYLDQNFRASAGSQAKMKLLNDQNIPVPESIFEEISKMLSQQESNLDEYVENIMAAEVQPLKAVVHQQGGSK